MDKRIAVVALALLVVAGAFLAWPSTGTVAGPGVAGGVATQPVAGVLSTAGGAPPPPEVKTEISVRCNPMRVRLVKMHDEAFAKLVGKAAKEKFGSDDAVIAECDKHIGLTDEQLMAWVENDLGVHP